jgi:FlaA1/EpsC-like NDP-sugar epimerase
MRFDTRIILAFAHDAAACALAWMLAFWVRFNLDWPAAYAWWAMQSVIVIIPVYCGLFIAFGLYRGMWRFASLPDLKRIMIAVGLGALAVPALLLLLRMPVPRSVLFMCPIFLSVIMGGSRLAYRAWKERRLTALIPADREPVLVIGEQEAAANLLRELALSPQWDVVAVVVDDPARHGREMHGVKVIGRWSELESFARHGRVRHAIIAMPEAGHGQRRAAVEACRAAGLKPLTVPSFDDLLSGRVTVSQIRHVELDDLLGRDPIVLDTAGLRTWISGRAVLVTGAGGSIGSELARQIARYDPKQLILFDVHEFGLYTIEQEFRDRMPGIAIECLVGDVKNAGRIDDVMRMYSPSVVFHAAAYKHVPLMESGNAWQAVQNNVLGTRVVAGAAVTHGVEKFVLISTDKAVNPTNVMGATKRLSELVCQSLQQPSGTRFVMVRFGNVLGSTGSVIPRFREQIARGGPVTVTHPEITRYFMSIPEAVQLVLQAGLMGQGGEVFVLDMGEPVKIADLARDMIRLSGFSEQDVRIVFTGLRPGEKLYEELLASDETSLPTPHPKLRIARARTEDAAWLAKLEQWMEQTPGTPEDVRGNLTHWVPEYTPDANAAKP